jgi:hypothetical protein
VAISINSETGTKNKQHRSEHDSFEHNAEMWSARELLIKLGEDYYDAKGVMSIQRVFHRSRVTNANPPEAMRVLWDQAQR